MAISNLLLESGSKTLLENSVDTLALENSFPPLPSVTTPDFPGKSAQRCVALLLTAMVSPILPPPAPADPSTNAACWQPQYADFARAAQRPVNTGGSFSPPFPTPPGFSTFHPTWLPDYPDFPGIKAPRAIELMLDPIVRKPPSQFGTAVRFTGSSQNNGLTLTSQLFGPTNFTIGGWFFASVAVVGGNAESLWMLQDTLNDVTPPTKFINIELNNTLGIDVASSGVLTTASSAYKVGRWNYVLLSVGTGGAATVYVGDPSKQTLTSTGITGLDAAFSPLSLTFVTDNFDDTPFDGRLWGWRVWNTPLTAGEALAEFHSATPKKVPNILAWWKLEHAATKLVDSSGLSRTLAPIGAGSWSDQEGPFLTPDAGDPSTDVFPWQQQQPDPVRLVSPTTSLYDSGGGCDFVFTPTSSVFDPSTAPSWQSEFPDFVTSLEEEAAEETTLSFVPLVTTTFDPSSSPSWLPEFPDFVRDPARATDLREQYSLVNPDFVPKLSWTPTFADFARSPLRAVNEGTVFRTHVEYEPTDWFPQYDDFARAPVRATELREGYSFDNFDFVPKLSWAPSFPDFARASARPVNEGGVFRTHVEYEPTDWFPYYQDTVPGAPRALELREGGATYLNPDFVPKLAWSPTFPDFARGRAPLVTEGVFSLNIQEREPSLDWGPEFPDFARGPLRPVNVGERPFVFTPAAFDPSASPSWLPEFPDFARAPLRAVNEGTVFRTHVEYEPTDWFPQFDDFARSPARATELREGYFFDNFDFVPKLSWAPSFPDFARSAQRPVNEGGVFRTPVEYEPTDWFPYFQDFVTPAPRALELRDGGASFVNIYVAPLLSWQPLFPDFAGRSALRPVNEGGVFRTHVEYEPIDWFPYYQDTVPGAPRALELREGGATYLNPEFVPKLAWSPTFPDFARSALRPVAEGTSIIVIQEREPSLDWAPEFPDFAPGPLRPVNQGGQPFLFTPAFLPSNNPSWIPDYPDFARSALRAVNEGGVFRTHVEYEPTDWFPSYPDFAYAAIRSVDLREQYAFLDPDFVPKLAWTPSFPDFARARSPLVATGEFALNIQEREPTTDWIPDFPDFARSAPRAVNEGGVFRTHVEYEPTDWFPYYQDFVPPAPRALELREGGAVFVDLDIAPSLSWAPTFPDFPARVAPRPVNEGGVFRTHVEYEPTDWFPYFQDFVTPAPRALELREGGAVFVDLDVAPKLSWAPSFPDFPSRGLPRPVNEGGVFRTHVEYEPTDWFPSYDDFARSPQRATALLEQNTFVNFDFVSKLSWAPTFPDFAQGKQPLVAVGAFTLVIEEREPTTDWSPIFPDFARAASRPLNVGGSVAPVQPIVVIAVPYGWHPEFPDFARAKATPVNTGGEAPLTIEEREPQLDWLSEWPDFARTAPRAVNEGGVFRTHLEHEPFVEWLPDFPDFPGRGSLRPVNQGGLTWTNVEREPTTDWLPDFPDFPGRGSLRPVNQGGLTWTNVEREPVVDWLPEFPDFARAPQRPVNQGGVTWTNVEREPTTDWSPIFPDFARSAKRPVNEGGQSFDNFDFIPRLAWSPSFPDFAREKARPVNTGGLTWTNVEREPIVDWLPEFPDFARSPRRAVNEGGSFFQPVIHSILTDWLPEFADFARAAQRPVNQGGLTWTNVEHEPTIDWLPEFPDFARAPLRPVNEGGGVFQPVIHSIFTDWLPEFADFARAAQRPVNQGGLTWTNVEREPQLDWLPTFPDFARAPLRPVDVGYSVRSFVVTFVDDLHGSAIYITLLPPDFGGGATDLTVLFPPGSVSVVGEVLSPPTIVRAVGPVGQPTLLPPSPRNAEGETLTPPEFGKATFTA